MPNDKEIRIRAVLDAQSFDQSVTQIQNKLKTFSQEIERGSKTQQQLNIGGGQGILGIYARQAFGDYSKNTQRQLEQMLQTQRKEATNQRINIRAKQQELNKISKIDKTLTDQQKKRLRLLKEEITLLKTKHRLTLTQAATTHKLLGDISSYQQGQSQQGMGPQYNLSSMKQYRQYRKMGFGPTMSRGMGAIGGPAVITGALGTIIGTTLKGVFSSINEVAERQRNITLAQGGAMQGGVRPISAMIHGKGLENVLFSKERAKSFGIMRQEMSTRRLRDILGSKSGMGALGGLGMLAAGTALDFTGIGSALGVPLQLSGLGMMGAGGLGFALNKQNRIALLNRPEYKSQLTKEAMGRQVNLEHSLRLLNFSKQKAGEFYNQESPFFNQFQQQFGVANAYQKNGFLSQMIQKGIPARIASQLAGGMMGAGGITPGIGQTGSIKNAFLLQQSGMTNAGKMVGLMRSLGKGFGETPTDESLRKFFAQAVKSGVNDSKMVGEIRIFGDASMTLAKQSGMRVEEAAAQIGKGMIGGISTSNIKAAQGAYAMRRQMSSGLGASLQYKLAYSQTQEGRGLLGGMTNMNDIIQFSHLDLNNITENNPIVKSLMSKMGVTDINEFRKRKQAFDVAGGVMVGPLRKRFKSFAKKIGAMTPEQRGKYLQSPAGSKEAQEVAAGLEQQGIGLKTPYKTMMSLMGSVGQTLSGQKMPEEYGPATLQGAMKAKGAAATTTQTMTIQAKDFAESMKLLTKPSENGKSPIDMIRNSAQSYDASAAIFSGAVQEFRDAIRKGMATGDVLKIMQDAIIAIEKNVENPTAKSKAEMERVIRQSEARLRNQPKNRTNNKGH